MFGPERIHFLLYGVGCFWSLLVWTVAAGTVAKFNDYSAGYSPDRANATLAWGLLVWLYYTAALVVLLFISSANIFVAVITDICFLSFFFIFGLGAVGALSDWASLFRLMTDYESTKGLGSIGQATIALGWLLIFIILGTLVFEVVVMVRNYGTDWSKYRMSFHDLHHPDVAGGHREKGISAGSGPAPIDATATAQSPV